jgi:hypothetical protein
VKLPRTVNWNPKNQNHDGVNAAAAIGEEKTFSKLSNNFLPDWNQKKAASPGLEAFPIMLAETAPPKVKLPRHPEPRKPD